MIKDFVGKIIQGDTLQILKTMPAESVNMVISSPPYSIRFGCPPGGIVLDCFGGAGTTAIVAKKLGRNYILIELNPKYIELAEKRIKLECPQTLNL